MTELVKQPVEWIDSNTKLEIVCGELEDQPILALDTEFMRSDTYYPITGLIQINDGSRNLLIDPKEVDDYYPLVELIDNPSILKVFHSCSEDLEVFHRTTGSMPAPIFDTQIAGALAGYGFSMGFANMVRVALNVELPKTETRSDWLARPLSQHQIYYAAMDVEYLYALACHLMERLESRSRLSWAKEESESLVTRYFENQDPASSYLRFRSAWKLNARQLAVLIELTKWREDFAQERDQPRNRIIKESAAFEIAKIMPKQVAQLRNIEGLSERMIRTNGKKIISIVTGANELEPHELPEPIDRPLGSDAKPILKSLREFVSETADRLGVPPEILLKKKDYEYIAERVLREDKLDLPANLRGWRKDPIGNPILNFLQS